MATKKQTGYDNWGNPGTGAEYYNTQTWTPYDYSDAPTASLYDTTGRFETKNDYNDADLKRYTEDPYTQYYTGGGKYTAEQVYSGIQKEKEIYNAAMAAGDTAAAEAAHQRAEAWRATAGYSGGSDGSQMITLNGAGIGSMGVSASRDSNGKPKSATSDPGGYYVTYGGGYVGGGSGSGQSATPSAGYEAMKASAQGVNNDADDIARQLYINYMKNTNRTNEMMGLAGLQGSGMQESSLVNLGNTYQESLYQNERARAESLQAVRTEIASMLASGQITQAEADALYAGIAGGSFDIALPETGTGGGYYEPSVTYYVPYTTEQTSGALTPSMTDAEMYNMLRGIGMTDSVIDTYFTPGQTAPTYQQIVDEYAALNAPQTVQQTSGGGGDGGGGGGGGNDGTSTEYYTVGQPAVVYDEIDPYWNNNTKQSQQYYTVGQPAVVYDEADPYWSTNKRYTAGQPAVVHDEIDSYWTDYVVQQKKNEQAQQETLDRWYTALTAEQFERRVADAVSSGQISLPVLTKWNEKIEKPTGNVVKFNRTPSTTYTTVLPNAQTDEIDPYWSKQNAIDAYLESLYMSGRK